MPEPINGSTAESSVEVIPLRGLSELPMIGKNKTLYVVGQDPNIQLYRWDETIKHYRTLILRESAIQPPTPESILDGLLIKRRIIISTAEPDASIGDDGDIWVKIA